MAEGKQGQRVLLAVDQGVGLRGNRHISHVKEATKVRITHPGVGTLASHHFSRLNKVGQGIYALLYKCAALLHLRGWVHVSKRGQPPEVAGAPLVCRETKVKKVP